MIRMGVAAPLLTIVVRQNVGHQFRACDTARIIRMGVAPLQNADAQESPGREELTRSYRIAISRKIQNL